jgi:hypothetical protein
VPLRSLVSGKSVAVYGVESPASDDFLHAIDGVKRCRCLHSKARSNPARRPRWCWAATPRVPPSWTSSPQRPGRSLDSQVHCRKPSLTTSRQWFDIAGTPFPHQVPATVAAFGTERLLDGSDYCWPPAHGVDAQLASIEQADQPADDS